MYLHGRVICLGSMLVKTPHMDPVGMSSFVKELCQRGNDETCGQMTGRIPKFLYHIIKHGSCGAMWGNVVPLFQLPPSQLAKMVVILPRFVS